MRTRTIVISRAAQPILFLLKCGGSLACLVCWRKNYSIRMKLLPKGMPMKGLRRNDDAMKNKCWNKKPYWLYKKPLSGFVTADRVFNSLQSSHLSSPFPPPLGEIEGALLIHHFHPSSVYAGGDTVIIHGFAISAG